MEKRCILVLGLLVLALAVVAEEDTKNVKSDIAELHQFPFVASIRYGRCGGSIIREDVILTSASCVNELTSVDVVVGTNDIRAKYPSKQRLQSKEIIIHEEYLPSERDNDIALVILERNITIDNVTTQIIELNSAYTSLVDLDATVAGWGITCSAAYCPNHFLRYATSHIMRNKDCSDFYGTQFSLHFVCTDGYEIKSKCAGNTGSPVFITRDNKYVQVGLAAFFHRDGCESDLPAGHIRVCKFLDWMATKLPVYH